MTQIISSLRAMVMCLTFPLLAACTPATAYGDAPANGTFLLTPACASGLRLDAASGGTANATHVQIWTASGLDRQNWTFAKQPAAAYIIHPTYDLGIDLTVTGAGTASGTPVQLWQDTGQRNQIWEPTAVSGGYTFTPQCAEDLRLDVVGGGSNDGTLVDVATASGGPGQVWSLELYKPSAPKTAPIPIVTGGDHQISLFWEPSNGVTAYNIYRAIRSGAAGATKIAAGVRNTFYVDTGLTNGRQYYYSLAAVNGIGASPLSKEVSGKPTNHPSTGAADPKTKYVPAGYKLAFDDEFNGASLDTKKWNTLVPYGTHFYNDEIECYEPQAVILNKGICTLQASQGATTCGGTHNWISGAITTNSTFKHGYFESRIQVPRGGGLWPAFWIMSNDSRNEWDILEIPDTTNIIYEYPHHVDNSTLRFVSGQNGGDSQYTAAEGAPDPYSGYVVYGLQWTSTDVTYWVNGVMTEHFAINGCGDSNMWVALNLAVGGSWPGPPNASTPNPARMNVDYVRIYQ